jgi:hypothetical protein
MVERRPLSPEAECSGVIAARRPPKETPMSMRNGLKALPWLMGAAAILAVSLPWLLAAQNGKVNAFALVPLVWSVALLAGCVHHLRHGGEGLQDVQPQRG